MKKTCVIMRSFGCDPNEDINKNGFDQSNKASAVISKKIKREVIIRIHHSPQKRASKSAEVLRAALIKAGHREVLISLLPELDDGKFEMTKGLILEKIFDAEFYDGGKKYPVFCIFISHEKPIFKFLKINLPLGEVHFKEIGD